MEPWDGPASIAFSDGTVIGAVLDRNGLRPSRYYVTKDDLVVMASEVGVLDIPPEDIVLKERLHPGRIFLVDTARGRIVSDEEVKRELAAAQPYGEWLAHLIDIEDLDPAPYLPPPSHETVTQRQQLFGYTHEDLRLLLAPMATNGEEADRLDGHRHVARGAVGSAAAALRLLQAGVRAGDQPAARRDPRGAGDVDGVDDRARRATCSIRGRSRAGRSRSSTRSSTTTSSRSCGTSTSPGSARSACRCCSTPRRTAAGLERALEELKRRASDAVEAGYTILILSDRDADRDPRADSEPARDGRRAPSPRPPGHADALRAGRRIGRRARSASLRAAARLRRRRGEPVPGVRDARRHDPPAAFSSASRTSRRSSNYIHALNKGILKVMSKMGISTLQSYCGAQIFEAVGLDKRVRRQVLHADRVAHRRRRHRRHRRGSAAAAPQGVPAAAGRRARSRLGRRISVAARRRVPPVQPGDGVQAAALDAERPVHDLQGVHAAWSTTRTSTSRRCAACSS